MNYKNKTKNKHITLVNSSRLLTLIMILLFVILNTASVLATVDLVTPQHDIQTNQETITFEYYQNINNTDECSLLIDSVIEETDVSPNQGFNEITTSLSAGEYEWSVSCSNDSTTQTSEERTILIDVSKPTVVLFNPQGGITLNTSDLEFSFVSVDNEAEEIECELFIDNESKEKTNVTNSDAETVLIAGIEDGIHEWEVTCEDMAGNQEISETRTFEINTTIPPPLFNLSIEDDGFTIGQTGRMTLNAPSGTDVRVEVCPDEPGFVQCDITVNADNVLNYPIVEYLPFTAEEGEYIIEALFELGGESQTQIKRYVVDNNLIITVNGELTARKNVPLILDADATGGVGQRTYKWILHDDTIIEDDVANITYTSTGTFKEKVIVTDEYNNTKEKEVSISVVQTYPVKIVVKDSETDKPIKGATVDINDEDKITGTNGEVTFNLDKASHSIIILATNYTIHNDKIKVEKEQTFTIKLDPEIETLPEITLVSPENDATIVGETTSLVFKAEYTQQMNCSIYINDKEDGFFSYLGSMTVSDSNNNNYDIEGIEPISYWWNVECVGIDKKTGVSSTFKFTSTNSTGSGDPDTHTLLDTGDPDSVKELNEYVAEYEQKLNEIEALDKTYKEASQAFSMEDQLKDAIKIIKNAIRDIDGLRFKEDLSDQEKEKQENKLVSDAKSAYNKAPVSFQLVNSETYVDYIQPEELALLTEEYLLLLEEEGVEPVKVNEKKFLKLLESLQQEVVISSKLKVIKVTYGDGKEKDLSIIIREIKTYNITDGTFIIESIPKTVAESADKIMSNEQYDVIKEDPIIKFNLKGDIDLIYYVERSVSLEELKKVKTAVFIDPTNKNIENQISGFSIKVPSIKGFIFLPLIIILLGGLVFGAIRFNGFALAKVLIHKVAGKKDLHYIKVVLSEIEDKLNIGDVQKAFELYNEAKGAYDVLPNVAKNDIYEEVARVGIALNQYSQQGHPINVYEEANQVVNSVNQENPSMQIAVTANETMDVDDLSNRIIVINDMIDRNMIMEAIQEYKIIEEEYYKLDDITQEMFHSQITEVGIKLQKRARY